MRNCITTETPKRPDDQQSVFQLRTPPMSVVRIGIVGLGERGQKAVERLRSIEHVEIAALCDVSEERVKAVAENLTTHHPSPNTHHPTITTQHPSLITQAIDLIYICTDWASHVPIALEAMNAG
ncbi:MAG: Gfo/Idh/MocA family oxidoreductase, partial [Prevotella sp.]|nr:Gfo/Idh/MocA family oxidoreductase [Prevotella sp.]